jgi:hypothetical protein
LRKIMLLRWSVCAVGAGNVPGGAFGGACFGALHLGEGRVPNRDYAGRGKAPVAEKSGVGVGRRLVGRRRAERRRAWRRRAERRRAGRGRRVGKQPPSLPVPGDGAPRFDVRREVIAFQRFLERAAEIHLWAPNRPWVRHPTGE